MKSKKKFTEQLNRSTIFRVIAIALVIVLIEVIAGICIFTWSSNLTYKHDYLEYGEKSQSLAAKITESFGDRIDDLEKDPEVRPLIMQALEDSGAFDDYVVLAQAQGGRVLGDDGILTGNLRNNYNLQYNEVGRAAVGGKVYLFSPATLGDSSYCIAGLVDYTARDANIRNLRGNVAAVLIVAGVLCVAALVAYAIWNGNRTLHGKYKYKLTIDKSGMIRKRSANFRTLFDSIAQLQPASSFDRESYSLVRLPAQEGDKLVAMRRGVMGKNYVNIYGSDILNADSFVQASGSNGMDFDDYSSFSKVFEGFAAKGKRTLIGIMLISNLEQIKTLFGKQMAQDIQRIVVKKVREKFTYVFELDFASIGVVYPDGKKLDILMSEMEDIYRYISAPIKMDDNLFTIELKTGFAMCDASMESLSFEYAIKAAEAARQRVIDSNLAEYIIYHESQKKLYAKYFIKYDIKQMLSEGAFEMEYQPQYNIKAERIEGFEALFRVKKSWNVNVDTFSFITYAERTGAMVQLGDFIFDTGMQFAKRIESKNVSVSLNVSPVQLMQAGFTENFINLYKKYDLKRGSICVEITESFLMTNYTETLKKLEILTSNGIAVHLDDFGTEYSSLLYIKKLPISTIKIDKEFVKDVLNSKESQAIIRFITSIAKLLNLTTICEGVETPQEFDMLKYLECDTIQGWLIGKSMKSDDASAIIDTFDYKKVVEAHKAKSAAAAQPTGKPPVR